MESAARAVGRHGGGTDASGAGIGGDGASGAGAGVWAGHAEAARAAALPVLWGLHLALAGTMHRECAGRGRASSQPDDGGSVRSRSRGGAASLLRSLSPVGAARAWHRRSNGARGARGRSRAMRAGLSALLALLAAAASVSVSVPVAAQGAELVSNRDQTRAAFSSSTSRSAQAFTTGDRAGGYVLSSVRVSSSASDASESYSAALHTVNASGHPATKVADLTAPSGFGGTVETFTAPANTFLAPETSYAVVVSGLDNIALTASNAEDTGAASGWSIADAYVWQNINAWVTSNSGRSVMLAIDGEERTNRPATGTVSISGAGRVGQMLAASVSEVADDDGLPGTVSYAYQWVRVDGTTETDVGTDSAQYMPVAADAGKRIKVQASFTDSVGFDETLESAAVPVRGMNPTACAANTPGAGRNEI